MGFETNVFINCPFDEDYKPLLKSLLFTIIYCGLDPHLSETTDSGRTRIQGIENLIEDAKYSIHDLSRMEAQKVGDLARGNFDKITQQEGYSKEDLATMPWSEYMDYIRQWISNRKR